MTSSQIRLGIQVSLEMLSCLGLVTMIGVYFGQDSVGLRVKIRSEFSLKCFANSMVRGGMRARFRVSAKIGFVFMSGLGTACRVYRLVQGYGYVWCQDSCMCLIQDENQGYTQVQISLPVIAQNLNFSQGFHFCTWFHSRWTRLAKKDIVLIKSSVCILLLHGSSFSLVHPFALWISVLNSANYCLLFYFVQFFLLM